MFKILCDVTYHPPGGSWKFYFSKTKIRSQGSILALSEVCGAPDLRIAVHVGGAVK